MEGGTGTAAKTSTSPHRYNPALRSICPRQRRVRTLARCLDLPFGVEQAAERQAITTLVVIVACMEGPTDMVTKTFTQCTALFGATHYSRALPLSPCSIVPHTRCAYGTPGLVEVLAIMSIPSFMPKTTHLELPVDATGRMSSRVIERTTYTDVTVRYICGNEAPPDHSVET
jgi:hypothetical protein